MKKIFLFFFALSILPAAFAQQAEVTSSSGTVEVMLEGEDDYTDAQEGMVLEAGDKIRTSGSSSAELSFNDDNTNLVRLSENTSSEVIFSGDEKLQMEEGEVFASISKLPSSSAFEIRTPTAVSGARGTDWVTKVTDEGTDVEAIDSQPYVKHFETGGAVSKEMTLIKPGQMTTVKKFQKPMQFRPIDQARQKQWQATKQDVRKRGNDAMIKRQQRPAFNRDEFKQKARDKRGQGKSVFKPLQSGQQEAGDGFKPLVSQEGKRQTFDQKPAGLRKQNEQLANQPATVEWQKPVIKAGEVKAKAKDVKKNQAIQPQETGENNQVKNPPPNNIAPRPSTGVRRR